MSQPTHTTTRPHYRVIVAETPEELAAVYTLRYEIYVNRMGIVAPSHPFVDGDQLIDPYDAYSTQLLLMADERPVGTVRVTCARDGGLEIEAYRPVLSGDRRDDVSCELTRLMILKEFRCFGATIELLTAAYRVSRDLGMQRMVVAGKLGNLGRYYRNMGMRLVDAEPFEYKLVPGCRYQVLVGDIGHRWSLRGLRWRLKTAVAQLAAKVAPKMGSRMFRKGISAGRAAPRLTRTVELAAA